jgi:hypothetical protein
MCDSVAYQINDYTFLIRCDYWLRTLGPDRFVTFMCTGMAIALENDDSYERLFILHVSLGDKFHTLMSGGIGSHLLCESTFDVLIVWLLRFGETLFVQAFAKHMVVSGVVKKMFWIIEATIQ